MVATLTENCAVNRAKFGRCGDTASSSLLGGPKFGGIKHPPWIAATSATALTWLQSGATQNEPLAANRHVKSALQDQWEFRIFLIHQQATSDFLADVDHLHGRTVMAKQFYGLAL